MTTDHSDLTLKNLVRFCQENGCVMHKAENWYMREIVRQHPKLAVMTVNTILGLKEDSPINL